MSTRYLALCSLLFASAACQAQSSVTIYGILDMSVARATTNPAAGPSSQQLQLISTVGTSSILGLRGVEDLGGGMAALFQLEMGTFPDTGAVGSTAAASGTLPAAPSFFNRHSWVALRSADAGTVRLGRMLTPTITASIPLSALPSGTNSGLTGALSAQGLNNDFFQSNTVSYYSPTYGGFSAQAMKSFGEVTPGGKGGSSYGLVGRYDADGNTLAIVGQRDKDALGNYVQWKMILGAYNFGRFKLTAGADWVDVPATLQSGSTAPYRDSRMVTVGGQYRMTDLMSFGVQHFRVKDNVSGSQSHVTNFDARYLLSKRTALFFMLGKATNRALAIAPINGVVAAANAQQTAYAVGVAHSF